MNITLLPNKEEERNNIMNITFQGFNNNHVYLGFGTPLFVKHALTRDSLIDL